MYASKFNVFCVTETWLSNYIYDCEILPTDFVLYRKDRPSRGGGVLIAVKSSFHSSLIPSPSDVEVISVKLGSDQDFILCSVYVPPYSTDIYVSSLLSYLINLVSSFERCVIVGDFNFPDINWSSLTGSSSLSNSFCEFVFDCNLTQHVMHPTHVRGNILDLVFTSSHVDVEQLSIHTSSKISFSDHFIISFIPHSHMVSPATPRLGYIFDYSNADFDSICSFLMDLDFTVCLQSNDIEFIWATIKSFIFEAMSLFVPKKRMKNHQGPKLVQLRYSPSLEMPSNQEKKVQFSSYITPTK